MADEGQLDAFLELVDWDGQTPVIEGESLDAQFKKSGGKPMQLNTFSLESQRDLSSEAGSADTEEAFTFTVTKDVDIATPHLFLAFCNCATDQDNPLAVAKVSLRKAAGPEPLVYMVYKFSGVAIKSWKLTCKDGPELPEEDIDFTFQELLITYTPQTTKGIGDTRDRSMGWNFASHEPR